MGFLVLLFQTEQGLLKKAHKFLLLREKSAPVAELSETSNKIKQEPEQQADVAPEAKKIKRAAHN